MSLESSRKNDGLSQNRKARGYLEMVRAMTAAVKFFHEKIILLPLTTNLKQENSAPHERSLKEDYPPFTVLFHT
jgi:hypothetical protein